MRNQDLLMDKIDDGIAYIEKQSKKLEPLIEYLTAQMLEKKEELTAKEIFDYHIKLQELKVNSLLVLAKMKEIQQYR